jgi:hypothetical protein
MHQKLCSYAINHMRGVPKSPFSDSCSTFLPAQDKRGELESHVRMEYHFFKLIYIRAASMWSRPIYDKVHLTLECERCEEMEQQHHQRR